MVVQYMSYSWSSKSTRANLAAFRRSMPGVNASRTYVFYIRPDCPELYYHDEAGRRVSMQGQGHAFMIRVKEAEQIALFTDCQIMNGWEIGDLGYMTPFRHFLHQQGYQCIEWQGQPTRRGTGECMGYVGRNVRDFDNA